MKRITVKQNSLIVRTNSNPQLRSPTLLPRIYSVTLSQRTAEASSKFSRAFVSNPEPLTHVSGQKCLRFKGYVAMLTVLIPVATSLHYVTHRKQQEENCSSTVCVCVFLSCLIMKHSHKGNFTPPNVSMYVYIVILLILCLTWAEHEFQIHKEH